LPGFFGRFTSLYQKSKLSTTLFVKRTTKLCRHEGTPRHEKVPLSRPAPGQRRDWHGGSRPQPPGDRHPPSPRARRPNGKSRGAPNALRCLENKTVCERAWGTRGLCLTHTDSKLHCFSNFCRKNSMIVAR